MSTSSQPFEPGVSRRRFVSALPLTVLGAPAVLGACESGNENGPGRGTGSAEEGTEQPQPVPTTQGPGFLGPFSEGEAAAVSASALAREITALNGQGYPCSEMILLAALRRFQLPENHLDAAAVFGGGVGKRDLCGLLTGGLMAIGLAAGTAFEDRAQVHRIGREASNAYWDWWVTRGDLHCMGFGTAHETSEEFVRMCQRAAVRLESVIAEVVGV